MKFLVLWRIEMSLISAEMASAITQKGDSLPHSVRAAGCLPGQAFGVRQLDEFLGDNLHCASGAGPRLRLRSRLARPQQALAQLALLLR